MCSKTTTMMTRRKTKNASSLSSSTATTTTTTTTTTLTPTVSRKSKTASTTSKSSRKSRKSKTKTRKKKFISLLTHLSQPNSPDSCDTNTTNHQLNLFPLHPENQEENVACFFEGDDGASLNEFIWIGGEEEDSLSPSLTYGYSEDCGVSSLERTALRHHEERDPSEEKWVCYSEVVEKKVKEEMKVKEEEDEMSCSVPEYWNTSRDHSNPTVGKLLLKLDYQEIMNAWSDKGPLYIDGGDCASQVVPDIFDEAGIAYDHRPKVKVEYGEVPIMRVSDDGSTGMEGGVDGSGEGWKVRHREASVLRYKRKRQNRLFSKRIRYEVRKLNAEKRPRLKGRFVKRN